MKIISYLPGTIICIIVVFFFKSAYADLPAHGNSVSLTIYRDNRAQVQSTHTIPAAEGVRHLSFSGFPAEADPASIRLMPAGTSSFTIREQSYAWDLDRRETLLQRNLSRPITLSTTGNTTVSGQLLTVGPGELFVRESEGSLRIIPTSSITAYEIPRPIGSLACTPTLNVSLHSTAAGPLLARLSYLTGGLSWEAFYTAVVNEGEQSMAFSGAAAVKNNTSAHVKNAAVTLIAGDIHIEKNKQIFYRRSSQHMSAQQADSSSFREQPLFEYHQYTLNRPASLPAGRTTHFPLFPAADRPVSKAYIYEPRVSDSQVRVEYEFKNESTRGPATPLPGGTVQLYISDNSGALRFIGEDSIEHTPAAGRAAMQAGSAFDVSASRTVTSRQAIDRSSRREKVEIRLRNHKKQDIHIKTIEHFQGDWELSESTHAAHQTDASKAVFYIPVAGGKSTALRYSVLLKW